MIRYLFRKWSSLEFVAAIATLVSFALSAIPALTSNPQFQMRVILLSLAGASLLWLLLLWTRSAFVIEGYINVMSFLELLARHAEHKIWTARTHTGRGVGEQRYFKIVAARLGSLDKPLEDFRRLLRAAPAAREHIDQLIADFLHKDAAEARYFTGSGPQFDFMIADDIAVIGFPMAGGTGNVGAVVLRHSRVVEAVANVFNQLWSDPTTHLLFRGNSAYPEQQRQILLVKVETLLSPRPRETSLELDNDVLER